VNFWKGRLLGRLFHFKLAAIDPPGLIHVKFA
jgi:hypothetical protein